MVADVENKDIPIVARRKQRLVILAIPANRLHLALVKSDDLLALEVVQVPDADGGVLGARGEVLLLNRIQMHTHYCLGMRSKILNRLLHRSLLLATLFKLRHQLLLLGISLLALLERSQHGRGLATFRIEVPYLNLGQKGPDNHVVRLLALPRVQPLEAQGVRSEDNFVVHVEVTGLVVVDVDF